MGAGKTTVMMEEVARHSSSYCSALSSACVTACAHHASSLPAVTADDLDGDEDEVAVLPVRVVSASAFLLDMAMVPRQFQFAR